MIGIGWATLYNTMIEKYDEESNIKIRSQTHAKNVNNNNNNNNNSNK
jgi:hypothetical protein